MPVLPRRVRYGLLAVCLCLAWSGLACGDAHWAVTRWPSPGPGAPPQPILERPELGLVLRATQISYDSDGIAVELVIENASPGPGQAEGFEPLRIERAAILFAWDGLEYPVDPPGSDHPEPEWIELGPGETIDLRLRYHLGRTLSGPGSQLRLRSLTHAGVAVVDIPALELPAMPVD